MIMNDHELLEMAAKAAGMKVGDREALDGWIWIIGEKSLFADEVEHYIWNPLADDGDAFRLALKLRINIEYVQQMDSVMCTLPGSMGATSVAAIGDAELRLAIVQAAFQLGKSMP